MKKLFTLLVIMALTISVFAQAPQKMSYQAVIRNSSGQLVTNHVVGMRISILQGSTTGTPVYVETQTPTTNANGLATIEVGGGTVITGTFVGINWSSGTYFIKTETDPAGGTSYTITGANQILSVPYALYSKAAGNGSLWSQSGSNIYHSSGNVGIGISDPTYNLDVRGSNIDDDGVVQLGNSDLSHRLILFGGRQNDPNPFINWKQGDPLRFATDEGGWSEKMRITGNGLVGIGTITPASELDVSGIITATGGNFLEDLLVNGLTIGKGENAISTNTAIGSSALFSNTTGYSNTASGYQALYSNTTGYSNTAIGDWALHYNTTGSDNTANGGDALLMNTTGHDNTAIGYWALRSNTTGYYNTANGYMALYSNTGGAHNTANGYMVLYSNTTGHYNTAIGDEALRSNTTGQYNIAIGRGALGKNTTGNNNTAIGQFADVASENLTNATVIGNNAKVNVSNNFVFGNSEVIGWGFGVDPGSAAIRVGSTTNNGNGASLTLSGVWTDASDVSKKYDIENIYYGLHEVMQLHPVTYKLKGSHNQDIGFIAQEVKKIIPEIVYGEDGEMTLSYGHISSVFVKAIQEQQQQIQDQQKEIDELKTLVNTLIANKTAQEYN